MHAPRFFGLAFCLSLLVVGRAGAQEEVPFVTTPDPVTLAMLQLAAVGPGDHVIDLGSGDGRIVITAARRFGASGLGVEIVPDLVRRSRELARAAGVQERIEFRQQDLFETDLGRASVVTMYLLPDVNLQLRPRLLALAPGTRVVSHDWDMGDWTPDRTVRVDAPEKVVGLAKASDVHLWIVPARVQGLWCASDARLEITQRFQQFSATLLEGSSAVPARVFDGRIAGSSLRGNGSQPIELELESGGLRMATRPTLPASPTRLFMRADGERCIQR